MNRLEKALLLGAASVVAYQLLKVQRKQPILADYYRGKVAVVTGGASGIGRAICIHLYAMGVKLLVIDRNEQTLSALEAELPGIATLSIDLVEVDAPERILEEALSQYGRIDLLFNNAGIVFAGPFLDMTKEDIARLVDINFTMPIRMTRAFLPYFLSQRGGVIAYTGSLSAHVYSPSHSVYTGTKGGLHNYVHAVRRELPFGSGVQLTIIHPNVTRTNLVDQSLFDLMEERLELQTPEEVATELLKGIAAGKREVMVRLSDYFYKWAERLLPTYADKEFQRILAMDPTRRRAFAVAPGGREQS